MAHPHETAATPALIDLKLETGRRDLLDLGLRNPLLNHRAPKPDQQRARGLKIVAGDAQETFRLLVRESKALTFAPEQEKIAPARSTAETETAAHQRPLPTSSDLKLQTDLSAEKLQTRLLATHYAARTVLSEQGVNALFLALGMLTWYEAPNSGEKRHAPLLLLPVELTRATARDRFQMRYTGDDIEENLSLVEKLKSDFALTLPALPDIEDLDVSRYITAVVEAVVSEPRWFVDRHAMTLGFFSFGKFLMYKDLDTSTWPAERQLSQHPIIQSLLDTGFREPAAPIQDGDHLDQHLQPADTVHVVDADSSQTLTIVDVRHGRNLVIQGPPGTGKSQTITNLVAQVIADGKTVLFVAEKMAALEVVKRRLDQIGLGTACLELHSNKTKKKVVIDEIARTLDLARPQDEGLMIAPRCVSHATA